MLKSLAREAAIQVGRLEMRGGALPRIYQRYFEHASGIRRLFHGIYPDFASAVEAVPQWRELGYDNEESADRVMYERDFVSPYDYPVLFWLAQLLKPEGLVFDWGGNVGISYFAWRHHLTYPAGLHWLVSDVPAVVAKGQELIAGEGASGLSFTTDLASVGRADILLAAGSMQFVEDPLAALRAAPRLPTHILINKTPLYDQPGSVTLQNMGTAICAYHLFNRTQFIRAFEDMGYTRVDEWKNPGLGCFIPFFPRHSVGAFSGFYFRA